VLGMRQVFGRHGFDGLGAAGEDGFRCAAGGCPAVAELV
jgi:hypothetical protein